MPRARRKEWSVAVRVSQKGCWLWLGALDRHGYGRRTIAGRQHQVHRLVYEEAKGAIPAGCDLDHLCRNPRCVNPAHLEPVTTAENIRRGRMAKLTAATVLAIRADYRTGRFTVRGLGRKYGVSHTTARKAALGLTWHR